MNMGSSPLPAIALIAGPTASGKSALAMALAERSGGTVINADSAQVYCDLQILSARPSKAEEAQVPHLLYGYRDGAQPCSAADWAADAKAVIRDVQETGRLPILAGGTGLYLRTLLDGIAPVPAIDPDIRGAVRGLAVSEAFEALQQEDPIAAGRLRPSDTSRVARALEVVRSTGRSLVEWQRNKVGGIGQEVQLMPLILLPPRDWLYERCDRRFGLMLGNDGLAECEALLARGLDPALPVMRAIGVPEVAAFLSGQISREEAEMAGQRATRRYAKRQYTWFSRQPPPDWPCFTEPLEGRALNDGLSMLTAKWPSIASRAGIA